MNLAIDASTADRTNLSSVESFEWSWEDQRHSLGRRHQGFVIKSLVMLAMPSAEFDRRPAHLIIAGSEDPYIDDVVLDGIGRCCRAGVDAELVEDVADVAMHRSFAHEQLDRDRVVCPASGEQPQHLELACAQAAGADSRTVQQFVDPAEVGAGSKAAEG